MLRCSGCSSYYKIYPNIKVALTLTLSIHIFFHIYNHVLKCALVILQDNITFKAINHSMFVPGFSWTPVTSISVIRVVLSGYRCVPLFVYSVLLL